MKNIALLLFALVMVSPFECSAQVYSYQEKLGKEYGKDILATNKDHEFWLYIKNGLPDPFPAVGSIGIPRFLQKFNPRIIQIVDDGAILDFGDDGWVYLTGFDLSNFADDERIELTKPVKYVGSKSYKTVLGATKTIKHFTSYTYPKEFLEAQKEFRDPNYKKPKVSRIASYKLKNGSYVMGRFVSYGGGKLVVQKMDDGKTISIATKELESKSKSYASKQRSAFKAKD